MRFITCNGRREGKPCGAQYALIKRVVAREEKTFFYPYNGNEVLNTHPYWFCSNCGKPLKSQIPIEIIPQ